MPFELFIHIQHPVYLDKDFDRALMYVQWHQVILQMWGDWKQEKNVIRAITSKTTKASQGLLSAVQCEKTRIFSPSSSSSWLLLNNWKLSKAEQFCPSEWEKILQWAHVVRRQEKRGLRFVISLPCGAIVALLIPGALQRESHSLSHSAGMWHLHCFSIGFESRETTAVVPFLTLTVRRSHCTSRLYVVIITCSRCLKTDPESVWGLLSSNHSWYESTKHRIFNIAHHYFNECRNVLN